MKSLKHFFLLACLICIILPGCASKTSRQSSIKEGFAGIEKVHLVEETDPFYLQETNANIFQELLAKGIKLKGYEICENECSDSIDIKTRIRKFQKQEATSRSLIAGGVTTVNISWIILDIYVEKNGIVIYRRSLERREPTDLNTASLNIATWFLNTIPPKS